MSKPKWIMRVPVISTAHMPYYDALEKLDCVKALTQEGGFVWVGEDLEEDHWLKPIAAWLLAHGFDHWVRFDADADTVDGLPTFEW